MYDACVKVAQTHHLNQEASRILRKERVCRTGVGISQPLHGINKSNLETKMRLNEGLTKQERRSEPTPRNTNRQLERQRIRANKQNSRAHTRQPPESEKEMEQRGTYNAQAYKPEDNQGICMRDAGRQGTTTCGCLRKPSAEKAS